MIEPPHLVDNPFFILELPRDCTGMDIERAGQRWLGMLKLGLTSAMMYRTPLGERRRDEDAVRRAMASLRDPDKRRVFEVWVRDEVWQADRVSTSAGAAVSWPNAHRSLDTLDR
jgi:hypothetical protein